MTIGADVVNRIIETIRLIGIINRFKTSFHPYLCNGQAHVVIYFYNKKYVKLIKKTMK